MNVTSSIATGNGRVLRVTQEQVEIELVAYSKGARYLCVEISGVEEACRPEFVLRPDRYFRAPGFILDFSADLWVCNEAERLWHRVDGVERTPEAIRFRLDLQPGCRLLLSTEPPRSYVETTRELHAIAGRFPELAQIHCLGYSMEHRPIFALRIGEPPTRPGAETKPVIHIVAGEHASEFAGEEIAQGMLQWALSAEAADARRAFIFDFILNANPDGNFHGWHQYNLRDWQEHNYRDTVDRSWHHEFVCYLENPSSSYGSETVALMEWMKLTRPAAYLSMHSWEGHNGMPGAYYTDPAALPPTLGRAITAITEIACRKMQQENGEFHCRPSKADRRHLGPFLMHHGAAIAYVPEGHYAMGQERLRAFGQTLLQEMIASECIPYQELGGEKWESIATSNIPNVA